MNEKMTPPEDAIPAWHITQGGRLRYGDGRKVVAGETLEMLTRGPGDPSPVLCCIGMHGCYMLRDTLSHLSYLFDDAKPLEFQLWRVDIWGEVASGSKKLCGRYRRPRWGISLNQYLMEIARVVNPETIWELKAAVRYSVRKYSEAELVTAAQAFAEGKQHD